jgi:iron complex transport system substrate-binding protein
VFFEVGSGPYAAGPESFMGQTLQRVGAQNAVPAGLGPFPLLSPEWVVRANPDVIMASRVQWADIANRPGWRMIRAVKERRLCLFDPDEADVLMRPGPRMGEAAEWMARCLQAVAP